MEIFREIEQRFERIESAQQDVVATIDDRVVPTIESMAHAIENLSRAMTALRAKSDSVLQEMSATRGAFAGIEAMLIANAAQIHQHNEELAAVKQRLDALERKAS